MDIERTKERWQELQSILDEVFDLPESKWAAFVIHRCGDDQDLLNEVKKLLAAEKSTPSFLNQPAVGISSNNPRPPYLTKQSKPEPEPEMQAPSRNLRIGPYSIVAELGSGTMGTVYRVVPINGMSNDEVAIKLLVKWPHQRQYLAQFQHQVQLLTKLNHPNIAKLYKGGVSDDDQLYLVMECVDGISITRYCDEQQLSISQRLHLIQQAAQALNYAHRHLIIHSDIKPANIVVTAQGKIKLLNLGFRHLMEQVRGIATNRNNELALLSHYTAPEQITKQPLAIATDIYQLGLITYQLLTGKQAFSDQTSSINELSAIRCKNIPTLPSDMLTKRIAANMVDDQVNQTSTFFKFQDPSLVKKWQQKLRGELDAIVMKALQIEDDKRYTSLERFSDDIEAYLEGRPVSVCAASKRYRLISFSQQHWRSLSLGATLGIVLLIAVFTLSFRASQLQQTLNQTVMLAEQSRQVSDFLEKALSYGDKNLNGVEIVRASQLFVQDQQAAVPFQEVPLLSEEQEIQSQQLLALGKIYFNQGLHEDSRLVLERASQLLRELGYRNTPDFAKAQTQLGLSYQALGDTNQAETYLAESIAVYQQQPEDAAYGETLAAYGTVLREQGDWQNAEVNLQNAIAVLNRTGANPGVILASALSELAIVQATQGVFEQARSNMMQAVSMYKQTMSEQHSGYTLTLINFGTILMDMERYGEAGVQFEQALKLQRQILGANHQQVSHSLRSLGILSYQTGRFEISEQQLQEALVINREQQPEPDYDTAMIYLWLGTVQQNLGEYTLAAESYRQLQSIAPTLPKRDELLGRVRTQFAALAYAEKDLDKAANLYLQALTLLPKTGLITSLAQIGYAKVLLDQSQLELAGEFAQRALQARFEQLPETHHLVAEAQAILGLIYFQQQKNLQALALLPTAHKVLGQHPLYKRDPHRKLLELVASKLPQ
jgi:serine/threonine-protein kinase